jgi:hypothetical protein
MFLLEMAHKANQQIFTLTSKAKTAEEGRVKSM